MGCRCGSSRPKGAINRPTSSISQPPRNLGRTTPSISENKGITPPPATISSESPGMTQQRRQLEKKRREAIQRKLGK